MSTADRLFHSDGKDILILVSIRFPEQLMIVRSQRIYSGIHNLLSSLISEFQIVLSRMSWQSDVVVFSESTFIETELGLEHKSSPFVYTVNALS